MLPCFELVPNWHQFIPFFSCKLKHEFFRKSLNITPHLSFKMLGGYPVKLCKISIHHYFLASY